VELSHEAQSTVWTSCHNIDHRKANVAEISAPFIPPNSVGTVHQQPHKMSSDEHEYLTLQGPSAYSHFRLAALKESINVVLSAKAINARVKAVSGIWMYYAAGEHGTHLGSESSPARKTLVQLLGCASSEQGSGEALRY
jgi:hypothetical protein